jgi:hypothetical protein
MLCNKKALSKWLSKIGSFVPAATTNGALFEWKSRIDQAVGQRIWNLFWGIVPFTEQSNFGRDTLDQTQLLISVLDAQPEGRFQCDRWNFGWIDRICKSLLSLQLDGSMHTSKVSEDIDDILHLLKYCALVLAQEEGLVKVSIQPPPPPPPAVMAVSVAADATATMAFPARFTPHITHPATAAQEITLPIVVMDTSLEPSPEALAEIESMFEVTAGDDDLDTTAATAAERKINTFELKELKELKAVKVPQSRSKGATDEANRLLTKLPATVTRHPPIVEKLLNTLQNQVETNIYYLIMGKKLPMSKATHFQNISKLRKYSDGCNLIDVLSIDFPKLTAKKHTGGRCDKVVGAINFFTKWFVKRGGYLAADASVIDD